MDVTWWPWKDSQDALLQEVIVGSPPPPPPGEDDRVQHVQHQQQRLWRRPSRVLVGTGAPLHQELPGAPLLARRPLRAGGGLLSAGIAPLRVAGGGVRDG